MGTLTAGIKEIFSSAKTTGSNVMLCGNDGTPDGHMTMANLASVLGATIGLDSRIFPTQRVTTDNEIKGKEGILYFDESGQHSQLLGYSGFVISVRCGSLYGAGHSGDMMQILYVFYNGNQFVFNKYHRYKYNGVWSDWVSF